jgi:hypothetical protein
MIPAVPPEQNYRFSASGEVRLQSGTWWRLMEPDHEIARRDWEPGVTVQKT